MTEKQKLELIKEKYPNYKDTFSQGELKNLLNDLDDPDKLSLFRERGVTEILSGVTMAGIGALAKQGLQATKQVVKATTAKEVAGKAIKKSKITPKRVIGGALGLSAIAGVMNMFDGGEEQTVNQEQALQEQANFNTQLL